MSELDKEKRAFTMSLIQGMDAAATAEPQVDAKAGVITFADNNNRQRSVPLIDIVAMSHRHVSPQESVCHIIAWSYPPVAGLKSVFLRCCGMEAPCDPTAERERNEFSLTFRGSSAEFSAERFALSVRHALAAILGGSEESVFLAAPASQSKPKLLVIVNPTSGPGTGLQRFNAHCRQLLCDAGYEVETFITSERRHATRHLLSLPYEELASYDGILACGGDGSMHEVLQGFLDRPDAARLLATGKPRLGAIPTGSGNGLAYGFCAAAGLPFSLSNSTLIIAQRRVCRVDIASVFTAAASPSSAIPPSSNHHHHHAESRPMTSEDALAPPASDLPCAGHWGRRHFSFLSLEWGIIADLDIESEALRCLGAARFDVYGAIRGLFLRKYRGKLSWLPASPVPKDDGGYASPPADAVGISMDPASAMPVVNALVGSGKADPSSSSSAVDGASPFRVRSLLPFDQQLAPSDAAGWRSAEGVFTYLWITNTSHQSIGIATAPEGRADDGVFTITVVRDVSPAQMISLLLEMDEEGTFRRHPFVEVHKARAYRLEPYTGASDPLSSKGHIVVDGELVPYAPTQAEVHHGLLAMFGVT